MGRYSIATALGVLTGRLIGGFIIQILGYQNLFTISSAVIGVSLLPSVLWVLLAYPKQNSPHSQNSEGNMRIIRSIFPMYMMLICYGLVWGLISSIYPGYANSIGISAAHRFSIQHLWNHKNLLTCYGASVLEVWCKTCARCGLVNDLLGNSNSGQDFRISLHSCLE